MNRARIPSICTWLLLSFLFLLTSSSALYKTPTYDERKHYSYGSRILDLNSDRFNDTEMPISAINAALYDGAKKILGSDRKGTVDNVCLFVGRLGTTLFSLLLAICVFRWSKELYGIVPGLISLTLYALSPNIIAHSRLITTDLYGTGMVTISLYCFWKFNKSGRLSWAMMSALMLGASQLAKYSCILLYPIFLLVLLVKYSGSLLDSAKSKDLRRLVDHLKTFAVYALSFLTISVLIINAGFLFNKTFTRLGDYDFRSDLFKSAQSNSVMKNLRVPVPYPFVEGLDWVQHREATGIGVGNIYLFGNLKMRGEQGFEGFKGYYLYAFLYKVPIPAMILIVMAIVGYVLNRRRFHFLENELFVLCPVLFFAVYFNFFFNRQVGIRSFLVVFPLLHVFCGSLFANWRNYTARSRGIFVSLFVYLAVSVLSYHPHYLSYFNELVWDRKQAYKILADSNIDWGQNDRYLQEYVEKHPGTHVDPRIPVAGRVVVSVNELVGVFSPDRYRWLRENFDPIDHIAYSFLVYEVPSGKAGELSR